ncbi:hypothetical protein ACLK1T_28325 [Escherichia coli]
MDVDGENDRPGGDGPSGKTKYCRWPTHQYRAVNQYNIGNEQDASQKFDPGTIRLFSNPNKENRIGNPGSYRIPSLCGGTHPVAKGAQSTGQVDLSSFKLYGRQLWVTRYHPGEHSRKANIRTVLLMTPVLDNTVKITSRWTTPTPVSIITGTTRVARAESRRYADRMGTYSAETMELL